MKSFIYSLALTVLLVGTAAAQPTIAPGGVLNNSSNALDGLPNAGIAQGSIFVVYGSGLGPAQLQQTGFPLPTTLAGTQVRVTVNGTSVDAPLIYTSATQVAALLPSRTPVGTGTITVTYNGQTSATAPIRVVASAFGITTLNGSGSGPAVVQNFVANASTLPINTLTTPAQPGQTVILYGTGLGPVTFDETRPAQSGDIGSADFAVFVGGQQAQVSYKGRSSCCAGLDQINFVVPQNVQGCYVPVTIRNNGIVSNFASISVAPQGQSCTDPTSFSSADLQLLQTNGALRVGFITLDRTVDDTGPSDTAVASFLRFTSDQLTRSRSLIGNPSFGSCRVYSISASSSAVDPFAPQYLDAGPSIVVTGPGGNRTLSPIQGAKGIYADNGTSLFLNPGSYSATNNAGGADVGGFTATFTVAQPLVWTNKSSITTVTRANGQEVTWTGGDPNSFVEISGSSIVFPTVGNTNFVSTSFECVERNSAGRFTIPAYVLQSLPATTVGSFNNSSLSVGSFSSPARFTAPGLDAGYVISGATSETSTVRYQ